MMSIVNEDDKLDILIEIQKTLKRGLREINEEFTEINRRIDLLEMQVDNVRCEVIKNK